MTSSGDPTSITHSEYYPYPVEKVWDVLVSRELTASQVKEVSDAPVEVGSTRVMVTHPQPAVGFDGVVCTTYTSVEPYEHIEQVLTAPGIEVTSRWNLLPEPAAPACASPTAGSTRPSAAPPVAHHAVLGGRADPQLFARNAR
ncbi:hypothetical protein L828_4654 [Mycobacteroides abscessus MAB_030201_1061]|nr:hypothetical protein L828_4654 [Mycobacteroides abscessus MAB_030201_1061]